MEEVSVAKGQLLILPHTLPMLVMIKIHLKLFTWNLNMIIETFKVAW